MLAAFTLALLTTGITPPLIDTNPPASPLQTPAGACAQASEQARSAAAAGSTTFGGLKETAKAALGALLGPLEREGAFDESAAVMTGV